MTAAAPERSHAQRMDALRRANVIRTARADIKHDVKYGKVQIRELLLDPPACLNTAKVFDLLLAVPGYGRVKASNALRLTRVSPTKTVGGLTPRQRTELVSILPRGRKR